MKNKKIRQEEAEKRKAEKEKKAAEKKVQIERMKDITLVVEAAGYCKLRQRQ